MAAPVRTCTAKLVLLGESAVGKTCIVLKFDKDQFSDVQEATIGAAFVTQQVQVGDWMVKFEIWDTAGQERYHSLAPMYYRGASAAIVVYDITRSSSFTRAQNWVKELRDKGNQDAFIVLAGNKCDREANRQVSTAEAKAWADSAKLVFFETSAKSGLNIREMFRHVAEQIPSMQQDDTPPSGIVLEEVDDHDKGRCCPSGG